MEIGVWFWTLGTLPLALGGAGGVALGPQPWLVLPLAPAQVFVGWTHPPCALRFPLLRGPWFLWVEVPPGVALARAPGHALVALVRNRSGLSLAWEIAEIPGLALFGNLGRENACGLRLRQGRVWGAILVRGGYLSLWLGFYF